MVSLFFYYVGWHYGVAPKSIIQIWKNFLWFFYNFFSIPLLLGSLFAPFERLDEHAAKRFDFQAHFEAFIVNVLMRIVGFSIRFCTILFGLVLLAATFLGGIFFVVIWLLAPGVLALLVAAGIFLLFV